MPGLKIDEKIPASTIPDIVTDVLIVGTGPAGASLAAFLSRYDVSVTIINKEPFTTQEPRCHVTNMASMECLRDLGIEAEALEIGTDYSRMPIRRYGNTMTGLEYFRSQICNQVTHMKPEYESASPCRHLDIPQNLLEPILMKAAHTKSKVRWNTEYLSYREDKLGVWTFLRDLQTNKELLVKSKFLCGADGGRSKVISQIGSKLTGPREEPETCYSITFDANLNRLVDRCPAFMHFLIQPDKEIDPNCMVASIRCIRPFHQFQLIAIPAPGTPVLQDISKVDWAAQIAKLIGDASIPIKLRIMTKWRVNEVVADFYSKGNVFCLGDAVHRHPPANGLGSNTSIQDAYNLAWKLAYVLRGTATQRLLSTYNCERRPVGLQIVKRANDSWRLDLAVFNAVGMTEPDLAKRKSMLAMRGQDNEEGRRYRADLEKAFRETALQFNTPGAEMNQFYQGDGIYIEDEPLDQRQVIDSRDQDLYVRKGTLPGQRLPHAWLATKTIDTTLSTHDLAGKGVFSLFTGIGGKGIWTQAAAAASSKIPGLEVAVFSIGWEQDYLDTDYTWTSIRGVEEDGAVLVRPDRVVCWRSQLCPTLDLATLKLEKVLKAVLGW